MGLKSQSDLGGRVKFSYFIFLSPHISLITKTGHSRGTEPYGCVVSSSVHCCRLVISGSERPLARRRTPFETLVNAAEQTKRGCIRLGDRGQVRNVYPNVYPIILPLRWRTGSALLAVDNTPSPPRFVKVTRLAITRLANRVKTLVSGRCP